MIDVPVSALAAAGALYLYHGAAVQAPLPRIPGWVQNAENKEIMGPGMYRRQVVAL